MVSMPLKFPVTTPTETDARILLLVQVPPETESLRVIVAPPAQTVERPDIAAGTNGIGLTVTIAVAEMLPQLFTTM